MFVWVLLGAGFIGLFGYFIGREVRKMRHGIKTRQALLALQSQPGWRNVPAEEYLRRPWQLMHHGWLDAKPHTVVAGTLKGREVVVAELFHVGERSGRYWLACSFVLPQEHRTTVLARPWSAAAMGVPVLTPARYIPIGEHVEALAEHLGRTGVLERLSRLGAPAVSIIKNEVCFLFHPMPHPNAVQSLLDGLSALVDDLTTAADTITD